MDFFHKLQSTLLILECELVKVAQGTAGSPDLFLYATKAALVRSYEFLCHIPNVDNEIAFFMMPFLRGVCEDYIVLKFFHSKLGIDVDEAIRIKLEEDLYRSAISQWDFFEANRPDQKLYYKEDFRSEEQKAKDQLKNFLRNRNIQTQGRSSLPSVRKMADESNLLELYDYVYHATSSLVHFNPRVLLRMGWGDLPNITLSVKNFGKYYKHFTCFYGAYMFLQLCEWSVDLGIVEKTVAPKLDIIAKLIQDEPHWPELVTFEEMNIGGLTRILLYKSPSQVKTEAEKEAHPDINQTSS